MPRLSFPDLYILINGRPIDVSDLLPDFINTPAGQGDALFEKYGPGNIIDFPLDRPYERLKAYEILLSTLEDFNANHFREIHKGTPYYFLGWTAFQIEDYEKGVFYLDSAISEDLRLLGPSFDINSSRGTPGIDFLLLTGGGNQVALATAIELMHFVEDEINSFSSKAGVSLTKDIFVQKFIKESGLFRDGTFRTIVTSLYSFILEFQSRQKQLDIRSSEGGSIEPFLTHLFKGCVIFESLLKLKPPGDRATTLSPAIDAHNSVLGVNTGIFPRQATFEEVVERMHQLTSQNTPYHDLCFAVAYGLRNTTGHQLAWPDVFKDNPGVYAELYKAVVGSILWTINKLWVD